MKTSHRCLERLSFTPPQQATAELDFSVPSLIKPYDLTLDNNRKPEKQKNHKRRNNEYCCNFFFLIPFAGLWGHCLPQREWACLLAVTDFTQH